MSTTINKNLCQTLRSEIDEALNELGKKYGMHFHAGNCSFSDTNMEFKLNVSKIGDDGNVVDKYEETLKKHFPELYKKEVKLNGETFILVGYKSRARKYKFIGQKKGTNQKFGLPEEVIF